LAETINQTTARATNLGIFGGEVRDVAIDTTNNVWYITTYSPTGFFHSSDNGATWLGLDSTTNNLGQPSGVDIDADGNVFTIMGGNLYESTDHGITVTEIGDFNGYANLVHYADGILYVGRQDGNISISTNGGNSFSDVLVDRTDQYPVSLATSSTSNIVYVVMEDGNNSVLYVSSNGGHTWAVANTDDVAERYVVIAVDPTDETHLILTSHDESASNWQSYNAGATWDPIVGVNYTKTVTFDSTDRIYMGVSYSDDNGVTWQSITDTTPSSRVNQSVWVDTSNNNNLFGASFAALAVSTDRGVTWTDSNNGITAVTVKDLAQSTDKNTVWAATNSGLAKTTDFLSASPTWEFPIFYDSFPESVWLDAANSDHVVVGGMGAMYVSTDGGDNWTTATGWDSNLTAYQIASAVGESNTLYAAAAVQSLEATRTGEVFSSTDGGATWTSLSIPGDAAVQSLAVTTTGEVYVGAGIIGISGAGATGIYNYDGTWHYLDNSPTEEITSIIVDRSDDNTLYATASDFSSTQTSAGGVYKTTDSGNSWTQLTSGLENASQYRVISQQISTNTLYVSGTDTANNSGALWKSTDGGNTWGEYYVGLKDEDFNCLLFDGLMTGNSRGAYNLKGKAKLKITVTNTTLSSTLKDAATHKKLKHKKVTLWKKHNDSWTKIGTTTSNNKAKVHFTVHPRKKTTYRLQYKPTGQAAEEYTKSYSKTLTLTVPN